MTEPNIFTGPPPGNMDQGRWEFTFDHLASAYGPAAVPGDAVYREEFCSRPEDCTQAGPRQAGVIM